MLFVYSRLFLNSLIESFLDYVQLLPFIIFSSLLLLHSYHSSIFFLSFLPLLFIINSFLFSFQLSFSLSIFIFSFNIPSFFLFTLFFFNILSGSSSILSFVISSLSISLIPFSILSPRKIFS